MRYNDWDVLLFPTGRYCKTPFKEFKVACQVIPDVELAHCQGSMGLPIVTCFVPSIEPGAPFRISVHSWSEPEITSFTKRYSKHLEAVEFEARVFIDGHLVSSSTFHRKNKEWPHIIDSTFELSSSGELALLKFPAFKKESLYRTDWHAGDDTGRIKVVISEGFPRDSPTQPFERVKNVVAFSFQHAPSDLLESSGIAWPNPSMWRVPALAKPSMPMAYTTEAGAASHGHSPRRQPMLRTAQSFQEFHNFPGSSMMGGPAHPNAGSSFLGPMGFPPGPPSIPRDMSAGFTGEPMHDMAYYDWINSLSAPFANDLTGSKPMWPTCPNFGQHAMPNPNNDMMRTASYAAPDPTCQDLGGEPMHLSGPSLEEEAELVPMGNQHIKVPTNTPTAGSTTDNPISSNSNSACFSHDSNTSNPFMNPDFAHSLTHSLLNQPLPQNIPLPASEIKSRKERGDARFLAIHGSNPASAASTPQGGPAMHPDIRKFSQPMFNNMGSHNMLYNTTASTSPCSAGFSSVTASRNASAIGGFDGSSAFSNAATVGSGSASGAGAGLGGTPLPLRNSSGASLNTGGPAAGAGIGPGPGPGPGASLGSSRKRTRNFTPASSKAIDDEDQPLRPSPHARASFVVDDDDSDSV